MDLVIIGLIKFKTNRTITFPTNGENNEIILCNMSFVLPKWTALMGNTEGTILGAAKGTIKYKLSYYFPSTGIFFFSSRFFNSCQATAGGMK